MINAYKQGKDLYATIASRIYHNDYWDNMENREDGTPNPDGADRRSRVKSLMLGITYSMGASSLAEKLNSTKEEAQKIIDDFYAEFPNVKKWIDETNANAKKFGFVEDIWGRRRRLPDIQRPKYNISIKGEKNSLSFNPILHTKNLCEKKKDPRIDKYAKMLESARGYKDTSRIKSLANAENVIIEDNGGFISRAQRQCVNARIQGSAATMSKKAMIKVHNDEELNRLGFRLMLAIHDELIGECPKENAEQAAARLCEIMKVSALPDVIVPFKCDPSIESVWYESNYTAKINKEYKELSKKIGEEKAFSEICESHCECTPERLKEMLNCA